MGKDYKEFLNDFCLFSLNAFPELDEYTFSISRKMEEVGAFYLKEWLFYSNEEKYYRYLRDECLTKEQFKFIIDAMFDMEYNQQEQESLFDLFFFSLSDLIDIVKAGHIIGCHTHTHPFDMRKLTREQIKVELKTSKKILEDAINKQVNFLAYPNGYYDNTVIEETRSCDFSHAFTTVGDIECANAYSIPRRDSAIAMNYLSEI